jgi:hypothetical protein
MIEQYAFYAVVKKHVRQLPEGWVTRPKINIIKQPTRYNKPVIKKP